MTVDKGELRSQAIHDVGCKLDDVLESSKADIYKFSGAEEALALSAEKLTSVFLKEIDHRLDLEEMTIPEAASAKEYVQRCADLLRKSVSDAQRGKLRSEGKVMGLEASVQVTKSLYDVELAKTYRSGEGFKEDSPKKKKPTPLAVKRKRSKG